MDDKQLVERQLGRRPRAFRRVVVRCPFGAPAVTEQSAYDESGDPSAVTRDYSLELTRDGPPCLTVWGGKITTYRKLAEEAVDLLRPVLAPLARRMDGAWTANAPLPGGDFDALARSVGLHLDERDDDSSAVPVETPSKTTPPDKAPTRAPWSARLARKVKVGATAQPAVTMASTAASSR